MLVLGGGGPTRRDPEASLIGAQDNETGDHVQDPKSVRNSCWFRDEAEGHVERAF